MKSRQRKKYIKIIIEYWQSRNNVLFGDFSRKSILAMRKPIKRYRALSKKIRKEIIVSATDDGIIYYMNYKTH